MSHDPQERVDHRHTGPADQHDDKTSSDSLHGNRDYGTGKDSAAGSGQESKQAGSDNLTPPGDPREPSRDEWEEIAKHQGLWTPKDDMPSPHLPK